MGVKAPQGRDGPVPASHTPLTGNRTIGRNFFWRSASEQLTTRLSIPAKKAQTCPNFGRADKVVAE
jgi:hypothetical protein